MNEEMKVPQVIEFLELRNVRRVRVVQIDATGQPMVVVGGRNAQGKSSVLDGIEWVLRGKKAAIKALVHDGALRAEGTVRLPAWEITRRETVDGKQTLEVRHAGVPVTSKPQGALDALTAGVGFDPEDFARLDAKQHGEVLRALVHLDLSDLDAAHACAYVERTEINRDLKKAEGHFATLMPYGGVPEAEVSVADLLEEIRIARITNGEREAYVQQMAAHQARRAQLQAQIRTLSEELEALNNVVQGEDLQLAQIPVVSEEPILARMAAAEGINAQVRANRAYAAAAAAVRALSEQSDALTAQIADLANERARRIAACPMPVPGLGFDEAGAVTYQGKVLAACSSAERLRVAAAIGLAANPEMPVLRVRDGSLLDRESMADLRARVAAVGGQIWIERVTEDEAGAIIIEDGTVKDA